MYRVEPEKKKRRLEEEDLWGGSLTASDIEPLPVESTVEENLWGGSLTSADVEMLSEIPVKETIEPEPKKREVEKD